MLWDVVVVGAGPAGAAAALSARRQRPEARVLLVDRAEFPRDKVCGDGIAPHALDVLGELGGELGGERLVSRVVGDAPPVRRLRLEAPRGATADREMTRCSYVIRRVDFDHRLVQAAVDAGVSLAQGTVRGAQRHPDRVELDDGTQGRVLVAADGASSSIRRSLGIQGPQPRHRAVAVRGYASWAGGHQLLRMAGGGLAYAWAFPLGDGTANVGYGEPLAHGPVPRARLLARLGELLPEVDVHRASWQGHQLPLTPGRVRQPSGRVLFVGDAAGLVNPLTGEGIYYALRSGQLAGQVAAAPIDGRGDPGERFAGLLRDRWRWHHGGTAALATLQRRPALLDAGVRTAGRSQAAFDQLVDIGLGEGRVRLGLLARVLRSLAEA